jgi:phage repressor protein C with HTH and peptisase S24 domain
MAERQSPGDRVKMLRETVVALSQRDFALRLGVSGPAIAQVETGKVGVSSRLLTALSDNFGVNPSWVLDGSGPMMTPSADIGFQGTLARITPVIPGRPMAGDFEADGVGFSLIRRFDLTVSAGNGLLAVDGAEKDRLAFSNSWLSRMGIAADLAALVSVRGDSMAPTIPDGATVLIDAREKSVQGGGVFAFTFDGEVYVKRLAAAKGSSAISMTSDNPAYPARVLVGAEMKQLRIAGRVRLVIATL